MAATAGAGLFQIHKLENLFQASQMGTGSQELVPSSDVLLDHKQTAALEMEQPGCGLEPY